MISLTINTNHGIDLPIQVQRTMSPNDLTSLLVESINLGGKTHSASNSDDDLISEVRKNISYEYTHNGRLLNKYLSLASQGVTDGSTLILMAKINSDGSHHKYEVFSQKLFHLEEKETKTKNIIFTNNNANKDILPKLSDDAERLLNLQILEEKAKTFSTQSEKIASLLTESFRIYDSHFNSIERYPRSQISYQRMLQMVHTETEDEQEPESDITEEMGSNENFSDANNANSMAFVYSNTENMNKNSIITNSNTEPSTAPLPALNLNSDNDESEEFDEFIMAPMFESIEEAGKLFSKNPWSEWTW